MANFYESKPMQWVKKAGEKVVGNKGIQAISSGMMMVMGVILLAPSDSCNRLLLKPVV